MTGPMDAFLIEPTCELCRHACALVEVGSPPSAPGTREREYGVREEQR